MHKDEQEPGTTPIDHPAASTAEEASATSVATPAVQVHVHSERIPLVSGENWTTPLIASAVIAVVMLVSFLVGVETIFPGPPPVEAPAAPAEVPVTTPAPTATDAKPEGESSEAATNESTKKPDAPSSPSAATTEESSSPASGTSGDSGSEPAPSKTSLQGVAAGESNPGTAPLLLSRLAVSSVAEDADTAATDDGGDRPGFFGRIVLFIKFFVLVSLSGVLASVVLGGLALVVDRPLGEFKAAISRVILCSWLSTLALFVPVSEAWLRDLVHYAVAALLFWITGMLILRLSPRLSGALLGGTVALLAATAIGSRIVVWATW